MIKGRRHSSGDSLRVSGGNRGRLASGTVLALGMAFLSTAPSLPRRPGLAAGSGTSPPPPRGSSRWKIAAQVRVKPGGEDLSNDLVNRLEDELENLVQRHSEEAAVGARLQQLKAAA